MYTILDSERLAADRALTPERVVDVIEGGNHAQFGNYGLQTGDGTAEITAEEQQFETVRLFLEDVFSRESRFV